MQSFIDQLIRNAGQNPDNWPYTELVYIIGMFVVGGALMSFAAVFAGTTVWWERRIAGRMQSRIGPNRVGPAGFLQWIADALKLLMKEDLIPTDSDNILFRFAPYLVVAGLIGAFVVLPFGPHLVATNMNVGLFFVLAVTALEVVGIIISGWSSNSKWSLLGGFRAAAQVVSYEIPAGMALMIPVIMAGSLSMQGIIYAQGGPADYVGPLRPLIVGGWPWNWYAFHNPFAFVALFIFFTSALAEGNRTPFDLPEAESELVAGFSTEYSGMRFAYYYLAEYANIWVMSAIATTLFLGGWQIPGVAPESIYAAEKFGGIWWLFTALGLIVFTLKTLVLVNVVVWLRWTLPRIRIDQMMNLCWKYFVPVGMALVLLTAVNEWVFSGIPELMLVGMHVVFFAFGGAYLTYRFLKRTFWNLKVANEPIDLTNW
jgi:NADH-quinone oxidoreductase subunit H